MGLLLTIITGLFFLIGIYLNKWSKNKQKISVLSMGLAFVVLLNLMMFDIGIEVLENFSLLSLLFIITGLLILKIMDLYIPHHSHHHREKNDNVKEHNGHMEHISIITVLALTLHNLIECMALYNVTMDNARSGILMCLAIGLHNIPLGFQVGTAIKTKKYLYYIILVGSGIAGGLISMFIGTFNELMTNFILCFTLGMLIYLTFFELMKEIIEHRKDKWSYIGIIIGFIVIIVSKFI